MRFKRIISAVLVICFLMTMLPMNNVFASQTVASKGVSLTTDAAFFAKLNLSASGLASVKSAVNSGNYTSAKSALLAFYKDKLADLDVSYATAGNSSFNFLAMHDAVAFSEYYRGGVNITSSTATQYTINIGSDVAGVYVLSAVDPSTDFIGIYSSEHATASYRPQLKLYNSSGTLLKTLTATEDNTVRPSYAASKYCDSTINYVRHTVNASSYLPYSNDSMRTYIKFDTSQIPSTAKKAELVVYAKLGTDKTTLVGDPIHLCVMGAYYKGWSESSLSWSSLVSGNYLGHFSWNGLSGGFNWKKPSGTPSEWLNYNTRFYELSSLVQAANKTTNTTTKNSYMTKVKNMLIDFINDAGAGIPASRDIEPANRCMEFPYIYKWLLAGDYITADENVKILSWLYDEATLLYNGVGLFSGTSTVLSDLVYTNRGFWHVAGLYDCIAFFKEFTESTLWNNVFAPRLKIVSDTLIHDDGSYNEVTFGYPGSVVGWSSHMLASMRIMGDTSSTASNFSIKLAKMVKYVVDCTYPGGTPPHWGQGGPSATKTVVTQFLNSIGTTYDYLTEVQELRYYLNHSNGTEPDTSSQYNEIKIVTDRTGWDSTDSMIFMNAKIGGNHGHRDSLALLFYYGGKALLTDTGMTSYDNSHAHFHSRTAEQYRITR